MNPRRSITTVAVGLCFLALTVCGCGDRNDDPPTPAETTLTRVGQIAPDFTLQDLEGHEFTLSQQRGKVVLINWFATWCPPCQQEMPALRDEIWKKYTGPDFELVSVAREEKPDVVTPFREKYGAKWRFLADTERKAYARYAEAYIPRNHLVGRDGKILFQADGYEPEDFQALIEAIEATLATP